jgi:peptide/nickel transport system ATP-binding protein
VTLQVDGLTVYYSTLKGDVQALENATFTLADGEIMGLAGESGCGKTTLGHSLVRLAPPMRHVSGRAVLNGTELPLGDMDGMNAFRFEQVSIIPQYAMNALNPTRKLGRLTADLVEARHVSYQSILPELKRRLDLVKLSQDVLNMYPIELSGGMKQRMVMVISTLLNPALLVADEITSALDVASQKAVAEMRVEFRNQNCCNSVMIITHDISILYQIADSILVMYAGQLAEKAATSTIISAPRHPYTQMLISSLPEVGVKASEKRLTGIPGTPPLLLDPPKGCRFRTRCPFAFDKCTEAPPLREMAPDHHVACWWEFEQHA